MSLAGDLRALVGDEHVLTDPLERHLFAKDAGLRSGRPGLVVFPATTDEVAGVVKVARAHGVPVIARGAGTGLAGGTVPEQEALLVVLTRMNHIDVDAAQQRAWVGPGVINLDLSRHTAPLGLHFAPDPSSQSACTVGGNIANNSGGPHCLAEGTTVAHVLALEMVTATGEVIEVGGPSPDPVGLDLRGVVVGSEGTIGIVTRALVKLTPNPPAVETMLLSFHRMEDAAATVSGIIAAGLVPAALEMMDREMTVCVENFVHAGLDVEAAALLLVEVAGHPGAGPAEVAIVEQVAGANNVKHIRIAADDAERALLWKGRKSAFGATAQQAPDYYLHDTVVPRSRLVEILREVYAIAARHDLVMMNVFHAGDGNLHPLMAFDAAEPGVLDRVMAAADELVTACVDAGGVLSGEHGIGMEKRDLMPLMFTEHDLDAQARIREAFDPDDAFNPGKVLPAGSRCFDFGRPVPEGAWV